jgi:hypothetical protein
MHVSIRIKGHLDPSWQERLEGLQIRREPDGTTELSGQLTDQAALYGLLIKLNQLSLSLLSLQSNESMDHDPSS